MKNLRQNCIEYGILLAVMLVFGAIYHIDTVRSGFDLLPGDGGDALLNILAADSWGDVFRGETAFRQNRIYYPFQTGRGFTDLSLTLYLLELPLRLLFRLDMYTGSLAVCLLLHAFGIISMFYLLRKVLKLEFIPALGGALLTFYCNACWVKLLHTQFFFTGLLPLLAICVIRYCQLWKEKRSGRRLAWGMGAALTYAWIAYSNYYTAFFGGLAGGIYLIIYWIFLAKQGTLRKLFISVFQRAGELLLLGLWGILLFLPFFYTYVPLLSDDYERVWTAAQGTLPTLADIVNVGPQNLLWGKLYDAAFPPIHKYVYENYHGLPLITLGVLLFFLWQYRKEKGEIPMGYRVLVITLAVLYILSVKFAHCISLWYFVWKFVPGGSAIRAGGRIYVFLMFPLMIFLWWMADRYFRRFTVRKRIIAGVLLFLVLALDNYNTIDLYGWKRSETIAGLKAVPPPPGDMKCFFITESAPGVPVHENWGKYGLTAWQMARHFKTFSINGYSGNAPAGFTALDPCAPDYRNAVADWVQKHGLTGVYSCDISVKKWNKEDFPR